jgi:hypothetical protein
MLQKEVANTGLIQIQMIGPRQTYHIVSVFHNASWVTVLDRVALESKQVPQRNHSSPRGAGRAGHRVGHKLRESLISDQHQIERQGFRVRRIELQERLALMTKRIAQATRELLPLGPISPANNQVHVERVPGMTVDNHCVSPRQHEWQTPFPCPDSDDPQWTHVAF